MPASLQPGAPLRTEQPLKTSSGRGLGQMGPAPTLSPRPLCLGATNGPPWVSLTLLPICGGPVCIEATVHRVHQAGTWHAGALPVGAWAPSAGPWAGQAAAPRGIPRSAPTWAKQVCHQTAVIRDTYFSGFCEARNILSLESETPASDRSPRGKARGRDESGDAPQTSPSAGPQPLWVLNSMI